MKLETISDAQLDRLRRYLVGRFYRLRYLKLKWKTTYRLQCHLEKEHSRRTGERHREWYRSGRKPERVAYTPAELVRLQRLLRYLSNRSWRLRKDAMDRNRSPEHASWHTDILESRVSRLLRLRLR